MENNKENKQSYLSPLSGSLHPDNEKLLQQCFLEFRDKMIKNEQKHGWTNEWLTNDWEEECRLELRRHIEKGDPKDVAIYGMFMMYRGWSTNDLPNKKNENLDTSKIEEPVCKHEFILPSDDFTHIKCANCGKHV